MKVRMYVNLSGVCHQCGTRTIDIEVGPEDCTAWPPTDDDPKLVGMAEFTIWNEVVNYGLEIVEED